MKQVPDSLLAFQHMFPDDDACAAWLIEMRGGHEKGWALRRKAHTFEWLPPADLDGRDDPARQQAVWAAYLMAVPTASLPCIQKQLGIRGSAWLLAHKLRASMVDPERNSLSGLVEIDEASLPFRTKDDPPTGGQGRSHDGKMLIVGAIELGDGNIPGRLDLLLRRRRPRSSKPPPIPTPSRKPTAGPATLRSPPIAFGDVGVEAGVGRPSMSSSFASTAAKPATLLSARSSASPPMQNPLYSMLITGAMCISGNCT